LGSYEPAGLARINSGISFLPTKLVKKPLSRGQSAGNPLFMLLAQASKILPLLFDKDFHAFKKQNKEWTWGSSETGRRNLSSNSVSCSPK
ncbi:hypothetical protein CLOM_g9322, partial [Closterium sp. NIES-68]